MTRRELLAHLDRVTADDVLVVLAAFWSGEPPADETAKVILVMKAQSVAFDAILNQAPEEPTVKEVPNA